MNSNKVKVTHVCTHASGGAFRAAYRFHCQLLEFGVDSNMLVLFNYSRQSLKNVFLFWDGLTGFSKIYQKCFVHFHNLIGLFLPKWNKNNHFSHFLTPYDLTLHPIINSSDIVHLHWVSNWMDLLNLQKICRYKRVVWTFHDKFPIRGGFHYDIYKENSSIFLKGMDGFGQYLKRIFYARLEINIICPSDWLYKETRFANIYRVAKQSHLYYGIDTKTYRIQNRKDAQFKWNMMKGTLNCLIIYDNIDDIRKGFTSVLNFIKDPEAKDINFIVVGKANERIELPNITYTGELHSDLELVEIYNAADFLLHSSLEDNLPNTLIESLCCGTPVLSFNNSGMVEMIQNGVNGILISPNEIKKGVENMKNRLTSFNRVEISQRAHEKFGIENRTIELINLYESIL